MDFEEVVKGDTEIFEPRVIQALLDDCLKNNLELLPFRVIGFFCGVRPDGELPRLDWSDIDLTDKVLRLRAEITKKKRLRFVDVSENALPGSRNTSAVAATSRALSYRLQRMNYATIIGQTGLG
jgi:integrase